MPDGTESESAEYPQPKVAFQEASRLLLRNSVLDAMRTLLTTKDWAQVTMAAVATEAGVSRQTVYNEFKSRQGLANAYALRLVDILVDAVDVAVYRNIGNAYTALVEAFRSFFSQIATDPLVLSLLSGEAKPDLLRLITTDSAPLIERAGSRLEETLSRGWIQASADESTILSRAIVRQAISYISMPPEFGRDVAQDLAQIIAPFIDQILEKRAVRDI
ncbi:MAG: TetR family transcriptional regulator [Mycobacteriaceae bacterium]